MKSYEALLSRFVSLIWKYWNDILILTAMDAGNLNDSFVCIVQCELDISAFPGGTQDWWCNNCRHQLNSSLYSPPTWESVQVSMSEVVTDDHLLIKHTLRYSCQWSSLGAGLWCRVTQCCVLWPRWSAVFRVETSLPLNSFSPPNTLSQLVSNTAQ